MSPTFTKATIDGQERLLLQVGWSCDEATNYSRRTSICSHDTGYCGPTYFIMPVGYEWPKDA